MCTQEDIHRIGKKLDKIIKNGNEDDTIALDLLKSLKSIPMKLEVLQKTRIGMTVNNLRKTIQNDEVISLSKSLIKNWKKLLPETEKPLSQEKKVNGSPTNGSSAGDPTVTIVSDPQTPEKPLITDLAMAKDVPPNISNSMSVEEPTTPGSQSGSPTPHSVDTTLPAAPDYIQPTYGETTDTIRLKCRELLTAALKIIPPFENAVCPEQEIANAIEDCIFSVFSNTGLKYKNRVRSRVANLKDARNPLLRQNVMLGYIDTEKISNMTAEDMASAEMKALRDKFTKEGIDDHQMAKTGGTSSSLLKCGKCKKRNCTYNQVQTRSADEPMTTFCFCNECGHRWKFC